MSNINQTMSDLCMVGAYFSRSLGSVAEFNIKSQLVQKRNHHVGIKKKKCRNINLGHSEHGENDDYKNGGKKKKDHIK